MASWKRGCIWKTFQDSGRVIDASGGDVNSLDGTFTVPLQGPTVNALPFSSSNQTQDA